MAVCASRTLEAGPTDLLCCTQTLQSLAGSCFKRKKNDAEDAGAASGEGAPGEPDQGVEAPKLDVEKITDVFKRLVSLRCCDVPPA